jgi:UPF0176 protein
MTSKQPEEQDDTAMRVKIAAFYKFVDIEDPATLQDRLRQLCRRLHVRGTILIAREGINATVSGADADIGALIGGLRSDARFADLQVKFSAAAGHPFQRLKVKIKPEIVTFGVPDVRPSDATGYLVEPENWNALISEPGVVVIDTRNDYEVEIGTFEGARNPQTRSFGEFRDYVAAELAVDPSQKIAMFCTGGIRCEKASAYLIAQGFPNVYQLHGGILNYLEKIPSQQSLWQGECFVFDERVALEHGVRQGQHRLCDECGRPCRSADHGAEKNYCAVCEDAHATTSTIGAQTSAE